MPTSRPRRFAFWGNAVIAAGTALALPWFWVGAHPGPSSACSWLAGLLGGTSFLALAHAIKLAPAATDRAVPVHAR